MERKIKWISIINSAGVNRPQSNNIACLPIGILIVSSIFFSMVSIGTPVFATPYDNIKDAAKLQENGTNFSDFARQTFVRINQATGSLVNGLELKGRVESYENTNQIDSCNPLKNPSSISISCDLTLSFIYEVCKGYPRASDTMCSSPIPSQVLTFRHYDEYARSQLAWHEWEIDISVTTPGQSLIDIPNLNITNSNNVSHTAGNVNTGTNMTTGVE